MSFFPIETRCYLQAVASVGLYIWQQRRVIRHCKKLYTAYDLFGLYAYILQPYDLHSGIDALILSTLYILLEQVHIATFLCRLLTFPNYFGAHVPKTIWWLSPERAFIWYCESNIGINMHATSLCYFSLWIIFRELSNYSIHFKIWDIYFARSVMHAFDH
jgi:hypothetical protein